MAIATHADPLGLRELLFTEPDFFDSLWYAAFPPKDEDDSLSDIDRILQGKQ